MIPKTAVAEQSKIPFELSVGRAVRAYIDYVNKARTAARTGTINL